MVGTKKAVLAQLVERNIRNVKVRSSILRDGSNEKGLTLSHQPFEEMFGLSSISLATTFDVTIAG